MANPQGVRYPSAEAAQTAARNDLRREGAEPLLGLARAKAAAALQSAEDVAREVEQRFRDAK